MKDFITCKLSQVKRLGFYLTPKRVYCSSVCWWAILFLRSKRRERAMQAGYTSLSRQSLLRSHNVFLAVLLAFFGGVLSRSSSDPPQSMPPFVPLLSVKQAGEEARGACVYGTPSAAEIYFSVIRLSRPTHEHNLLPRFISPFIRFSRPTACVTRWWAGRDNAALTEPALSQV